MKISCTRDNLHQGLSITSHLMTKNVNLPILQNVLVKADGGIIRFTSTNLEIVVNCAVRGKVEEAGEYTIPSKLFFDYVSLLPNETISIEKIDDLVNIECGEYKTKINGLSATEFPLVPKVDGKVVFNIPIDDFKKSLSQVLFSVAVNESRPELTGVSMQFCMYEGELRLTMASTDSYRLSEKTIPVISGSDKDFKLVIPAKTLSEVNRVLSVFKDDVELPSFLVMSLSDNQVVFTYGQVEIVSRIIEETYPDYKQIIPSQFQTTSIIDRDDFIKAIKTASLFSKTGLFDVTIEFNPNSGAVSTKAVNSTKGQNISSCKSDISGKENSVTVNSKYLIDGLQSFFEDEIVFEMIDASNPCLVTAKGKGSEHRYVVMPIKQ